MTDIDSDRKCQAYTKKGVPCKRPSMIGCKYCYIHSFGKNRGVVWWKNPGIHLAISVVGIIIGSYYYLSGPTLKNQQDIIENQRKAFKERRLLHEETKKEIQSLKPFELTNDQKHFLSTEFAKVIEKEKALNYSRIPILFDVFQGQSSDASEFVKFVAGVFRNLNREVDLAITVNSPTPKNVTGVIIVKHVDDPVFPIVTEIRNILDKAKIHNDLYETTRVSKGQIIFSAHKPYIERRN